MGGVNVYSEGNSHVYDIILSRSFTTPAPIITNTLLPSGLEFSFSFKLTTNIIDSASTIANPFRAACFIEEASPFSIEVNLTKILLGWIGYHSVCRLSSC